MAPRSDIVAPPYTLSRATVGFLRLVIDNPGQRAAVLRGLLLQYYGDDVSMSFVYSRVRRLKRTGLIENKDGFNGYHATDDGRRFIEDIDRETRLRRGKRKQLKEQGVPERWPRAAKFRLYKRGYWQASAARHASLMLTRRRQSREEPCEA